MSYVRPKKNLGQHFLSDHNIARKIVDCLEPVVPDVLEIGPGMGVLSQFLLQRPGIRLSAVEIDSESVRYLNENLPSLATIRNEDFLKADISGWFDGEFCIIGNFPYNISSQIFFKILENRNRIPEVVGMVQKEVAERMASPHGNKSYGILSVLLQAFYRIEYCFTVSEKVFVPPPKVKSAVVKLLRNEVRNLPCDEELFFRVVKAAFNQRRKMLRNSLSGICNELPEPFAQKRPEQLSVSDFIQLTTIIGKLCKKQ